MLVRCQDDDFSFTRRKVIVVALPETEGLVYGTLGLLGVRNQNATAAAGGTRRRLKLPFRLGKLVSESLVGMARLDRELLAADNAQAFDCELRTYDKQLGQREKEKNGRAPDRERECKEV